MKSEVFDGDSDTIIVDNSANCIVWRHKQNFDPDTYVKLDKKTRCGVSSAVDKGSPIGVGDLHIGWSDDTGKYHKFRIPQVLHIPDSPVNILGLNAFSKAIGDFNQKGTRINSSGNDSIFSWDNEKYQKNFYHPEADMPEMTVNDGYSKFHRFCNFIDSIIPVSQQCFNTKNPHTSKSINAIYECGEEVLYKNGDHVEKGIIEQIKPSVLNDGPMFDIKFRDDRKITPREENIMTNDETDVSLFPNEASDYVRYAKCLSVADMELIRNPQPLTPLQQEWKSIHDQYGHLPFAIMYKLVQNNQLPKKFEKLKGKEYCAHPVFLAKCEKEHGGVKVLLM